MGERYGICRTCKGKGSINQIDCGGCNATGFSGDIFDLLDPSQALKFKSKTENNVKKANWSIYAVQALLNRKQW